MKIERKKKQTVASVSPEVATVSLSVTGGGVTAAVSLSPKEARKLGKALRDSAVIVTANAGRARSSF